MWDIISLYRGDKFGISDEFLLFDSALPHGEHNLFSYEGLLWQEIVFVCRFSCKMSVYFCEKEFGNTWI